MKVLRQMRAHWPLVLIVIVILLGAAYAIRDSIHPDVTSSTTYHPQVNSDHSELIVSRDTLQ
jgi:hypothetical protein